jgi:hypothetical protein
MTKNERIGLVFTKTGSIISGADLIQNKRKPSSLGTDWIEYERFGLIFTKTIIFMAKTGSINSGTAQKVVVFNPKVSKLCTY